MFNDPVNTELLYKALRLSISKLNTAFPSYIAKGGLEALLDFRIYNTMYVRELIYKIDDEVGDNVKSEIHKAINNEARKYRLKVVIMNH